jgi:glutathione peroxidase
MIKKLVVFSTLSLFLMGIHSQAEPQSKETAPMNKSIYNFKMKNIDGKDVNLKSYKGKVVMVVNVASKCGYTPQYEQLEATYKKYKDQGFVILGFPANNFHAQEPGTNEEIKQFCTAKYGVTFPMFAKISVKGDDTDPLYQYLTSKDQDPKFGGDITWNFNKFLIDKHGNIIDRFDSKIKPDDPSVTTALESALKEK